LLWDTRLLNYTLPLYFWRKCFAGLGLDVSYEVWAGGVAAAILGAQMR